jgi:hypothetical protein
LDFRQMLREPLVSRKEALCLARVGLYERPGAACRVTGVRTGGDEGDEGADPRSGHPGLGEEEKS